METLNIYSFIKSWFFDMQQFSLNPGGIFHLTHFQFFLNTHLDFETYIIEFVGSRAF